MKSINLEEHPFRVLRTIRAIMDSLTMDWVSLRTPCFFEFGLYLQEWFRNFELPYALQRRTSDVEFDKIKFVVALKDYHLNRLWDVAVFRELMCNVYAFDEVDFLVRVRRALLKRPQVDHTTGS